MFLLKLNPHRENRPTTEPQLPFAYNLVYHLLYDILPYDFTTCDVASISEFRFLHSEVLDVKRDSSVPLRFGERCFDSS